MKIKNGGFSFLILIVFLSFASCGTLIDAYMEDRIHWSLGEFVNEWDESLGKYFISYDGKIPGWYFYGTGNDRREINIERLIFSESEGLKFTLAARDSPWGSEDGNILLKAVDTEIIFPCYFSFSDNTVRVEYSDELKDILVKENVVIRVLLKDEYYRYQFNLPAKFKEGYDMLVTKQQK